MVTGIQSKERKSHEKTLKDKRKTLVETPGLKKSSHHAVALRELPFLLQHVPRRLVSMTALASLTEPDLTSAPAWQATPGSTVKIVSMPPGQELRCQWCCHEEGFENSLGMPFLGV